MDKVIEVSEADYDEMTAQIERYRKSVAITDCNFRAMQAERDALKQRVDDLTVAMTTALEWLEGELGFSLDKARSVLAKALRKEGE